MLLQPQSQIRVSKVNANREVMLIQGMLIQRFDCSCRFVFRTCIALWNYLYIFFCRRIQSVLTYVLPMNQVLPLQAVFPFPCLFLAVFSRPARGGVFPTSNNYWIDLSHGIVHIQSWWQPMNGLSYYHNPVHPPRLLHIVRPVSSPSYHGNITSPHGMNKLSIMFLVMRVMVPS